eukprot:CAMPEP_0115277980 /NCGR_PEP_ID=MMETSP0270-20121206/57521_1 /TAXON_ID=71861 /ORGANISM="Scrippsiella trochoidea, Strain CCMP3099" /LENGTH=101 /DNA_ID=CAMNT_0002694641 /DNA_START=136 /DNA_END=442 /DNA_ORIENTATION=+
MGLPAKALQMWAARKAASFANFRAYAAGSAKEHIELPRCLLALAMEGRDKVYDKFGRLRESDDDVDRSMFLDVCREPFRNLLERLLIYIHVVSVAIDFEPG